MKKVFILFLLFFVIPSSCVPLFDFSKPRTIIINPPIHVPVKPSIPATPSEPIEKPKLDEKQVKKVTIAGLSNEKYGWGLSVTTNETSPGITDSWKKLLQKYNGYYLGDSKTKKVYLTFDCGYEAGYTDSILDILIKNNVPTIFFLTGQYIDDKPDLVKKMAHNGFLIGNHTLNHPSMPKISDNEITNEINGLEKKIKSITGYETIYFRPPSGEFSERTLALTNNLGYKTIFWSLAMKDWVPMTGGPDESYQTVMRRIHSGAIILLHAVSKDNEQALQRIIDGIRKKGYVFSKLDF